MTEKDSVLLWTKVLVENTEASIKDVNQLICAGVVKPSEICKSVIDLTTVIKPLNAYITVTNELALEQSKDADKRRTDDKSLGELDGIPIAIKDNFCTEGILTTCGSKMLSNFIPSYNATVYQRLKDAGAILIGKTNLDEFSMGSGTIDSYFGPTRNLWGSEISSKYYCISKEVLDKNDWHIAGGSSGGSAVAVASGTCYAALGSDTGGSIRNPASYCGLVGLKPTYGLISRNGLIPLLNSMDTPGIIARTVDDATMILNKIAGPDLLDSTSLQKTYSPIKFSESIDLTKIRIGIPDEYQTEGISKEIQECWKNVAKLLEEGGASVVPVSLPHTDLAIMCYFILNRCDIASNLACYDGIEYGYRANEDLPLHQSYKASRSQGFGEVVKGRIVSGNYFLLSENYDQYYVKAMQVRRLISQDFDNVWNSNIDFLLTPTTLTESPKFNEFSKLDNQTQCTIQDHCTIPANMAGIPAVNLPITLSKRGLPLSLQIMSPRLTEKHLLTIAKWIESTVNFPTLRLKEMV